MGKNTALQEVLHAWPRRNSSGGNHEEWSVSGNGLRFDWRVETFNSKPNGRLTYDECEAAARLITAGPDLLQACRCALADLEGIMPEFEPSGDREHPGWQTIIDLRRAISKATGEEHKCPTCKQAHEVCPRCGQDNVQCPEDDPGEPFAWCERCEEGMAK